MSVRPVCWPDVLHSVAPWRTRKIRGAVTLIAAALDSDRGPEAAVAADQRLGGTVVDGAGRAPPRRPRRSPLRGGAGGPHPSPPPAPPVERGYRPEHPPGG